jgi:hypothetical protein
MRLTAAVIDRFLAKVDRNGPLHPILKTRCHLWTASKFVQGYGQFRVGGRANGKLYRAHRVAFFIKHGRWPVPQALHRCDVRACVRLDHLFEGNDQDNAADKAAKGRGNSPSGEAHGSAKLTLSTARAIKRKFNTGHYTKSQLSREYDISRREVANIVNGVNWVDA